MKHIGLLSALGVAGAVLSMSTASLAAPPPPPAPTMAGPRTTERVVSYTGPNLPLVSSGLGMLGLAYVPSVVVAAASSQSADRNLFIPVAGPWLDIANRPPCGGDRGPSCRTETTNKMLLGIGGIFQGVGAAMTAVGLVPVHHEVLTTTTVRHAGPTIRISPAMLGTGYGVTAVGTW